TEQDGGRVDCRFAFVLFCECPSREHHTGRFGTARRARFIIIENSSRIPRVRARLNDGDQRIPCAGHEPLPSPVATAASRHVIFPGDAVEWWGGAIANRGSGARPDDSFGARRGRCWRVPRGASLWLFEDHYLRYGWDLDGRIPLRRGHQG